MSTIVTKTTATSFDNIFETGLHYERNGERVEMVLMHLPASTPTFNVATYPLQDNPNCDASAHLEFSLSEARQLRDQLNTLNLDAE